MADGWYLFDGARQLGPFSLNGLKHRLQVRNSSAVHVWREGLTDWVRPADLPEFAPAVPPPIPTVPENEGSPHAADPVTPNPDRSNNFIAKNWRGEFSLATSFWLFGFLGNLCVGIVAIAIVAALQAGHDYQPTAIFASILLVWLAIGAVATWQLVGVWRSANRHIKERRLLKKKSPWAVLAKVSVVIGVLRLGATFLSSGGPQLWETGQMSFLDDPGIPAYAIRVMRNGTEAEIIGGFKYGLTDDFLKIFEASPGIKVVHLDSVGGRVGEAVKLNKVIRDKGLDTYVSSKCASACTVAFAGGGHRILRKDAVLGFHAPSFPGVNAKEIVGASKDQRDIFAAAGFDRKFIDRALSTPNDELWKPEANVLLQARVVTAISDGNDHAISGLGASPGRDDFAAMLAKAYPLVAALKTRFPDDYDSVMQASLDNFRDGKAETELLRAGSEKVLDILQKLRPFADDAVLSDLSAVYAAQYEALGSKSQTLCYQFASGTGAAIGPSDIPASLVAKEADVNRRVVETATARATADPAATEAVWKKVQAALAAKGINKPQLLLLWDKTVPSEKHGDYCVAATLLFKEINKLPVSEAGIAMRDMLAEK